MQIPRQVLRIAQDRLGMTILVWLSLQDDGEGARMAEKCSQVGQALD